MTPQEAKELVSKHAAQLAEHFDAVQILVSFPVDGGTQPIYTGAGNWFARQGMANDFIHVDQAKQLATEIASTERE